jgi:hypothetical protein
MNENIVKIKPSCAFLILMHPFSILRLAPAWFYSWFRHVETTAGEMKGSSKPLPDALRNSPSFNIQFKRVHELLSTRVVGCCVNVLNV